MSNAFFAKPIPILGASGSVAFGSPLYLANDYMGVTWGSSAAQMVFASGNWYHTFFFDLGSDQTVDTMLLLGLNAAVPANAQVAMVATPAGGGSWVSANFTAHAGTELLANGDSMIFWTAPVASPPPPSRYWQINVFAPTQFDIRLRRAVLAKRFQPSRNFSFGGATGVRDLGSSDWSRRGVFLRNPGARLRTTGLTFSSLFREEVEAAVQPLLQAVGNTDPVVLVTDPDPHAMRTRRSYFGPLIGDLGTIRRNSVGHSWQANLVSLF